MKNGRIFLDRFSSIDHLTKRELADDDVVMHALRSTPRVSTFEMSETPSVRNGSRAFGEEGIHHPRHQVGRLSMDRNQVC